MGSSTHSLDGSDLAWKSDEAAAFGVAAILKAARTLNQNDGATPEAWTVDDALHEVFGLDEWGTDGPSLSLADDRVAYFDKHQCARVGVETAAYGLAAHELVAHLIAPHIERGCWGAWECDGEPYAMVFDGERVRFCTLVPKTDIPLRGVTE